MEEQREASVAGLRGAGQVGCWQDEGLEVWLRTGAFPQRAAEFLSVSRATGEDLSFKHPSLGSEGVRNRSKEHESGTVSVVA